MANAEGQTRMDALDDFLTKTVEGYLLEDLATLKLATPRSGARDGGVGYPLVMTACAGIELFGALLSMKPFSTAPGQGYFEDFWRDWLYSADANRASAAEYVYSLLRHGLAHVYVTKGSFAIHKDDPGRHLVFDKDDNLCISATQLAADLAETYWNKIKSNGALKIGMAQRFKEMALEYGKQAGKKQRPNLPRVAGPPQTVPTGSAFPHPMVSTSPVGVWRK